MARSIYCHDCDTRVRLTATKFQEHYESLSGTAINEMRCDSCGKIINKEDVCFAACLLPDTDHFNYSKHKPIVWALNYINL